LIADVVNTSHNNPNITQLASSSSSPESFFTCQPQCQQRAADINAPLLLMQSVAGVVASVVYPDPERVRIHFGLLEPDPGGQK
jgi:hypothetical protein